MAAHSNIVGGSTAKRVINCPGSVALVQQVPPKPSSSYADEGTLLHNTIAAILETGKKPEDFLGTFYNGVELTEDRLERKLLPALAALDEIDPEGKLEYAVEQVVGFGDVLPGVFGSADLVGRIGNRGILLDWKFGDGVAVEAEENPQALFYTAAALRTEATRWAFEGVDEVEVMDNLWAGFAGLNAHIVIAAGWTAAASRGFAPAPDVLGVMFATLFVTLLAYGALKVRRRLG